MITVEVVDYPIKDKQGHILHVVRSVKPLSEYELDCFRELVEAGARLGTSKELRLANLENQRLREKVFGLEQRVFEMEMHSEPYYSTTP